MSAAELKEQEENGVNSGVADEEQNELSSLAQKAEGGENTAEPNLYHPEKGRGLSLFDTGSSKSKLRKRLLFIGGPLGIGLIVLIVLASIFLGQLKAVHFATVLRSSGFATFQFSMRRFFADVAFDKTAFSKDSTGTVKNRPESSLLRRLITGNDARTVITTLRGEGRFNYVLENGQVRGFDLNGTRVTYDDLAKKITDGKKLSYDELNLRERMTLRKTVVDEIQLRLGERLGVEARSFRNAFWKGFRDITGIRMSLPRKIARDLVGKKPLDAQIETRLNEDAYTAKGEATPESGVEPFKKMEDAVRSEVGASIKNGERLRGPNLLQRGLTKIGIAPEAFAKKVENATPTVLIGTLYCIGHDLGKTGDTINRSLEQKAARYGHDQQTVAEQIQAGQVSAEAVSAFNASWDAVKASDGTLAIPPAEASPYYAAYTGQPASKADMNSLKEAPSTRIDTPFDWLGRVDSLIKTAISLGTIHLPLVGKSIDEKLNSAVDGACAVVLDPKLQTAFVVFDVAAALASDGGYYAAAKTMVKAAAFFGGGTLVGNMIQQYVNNLAGTGFGPESGVDKFNSSAIATDYLNSQSNRGVAMGRPLSADEAAGSKTAALIETRKQFQDKSWQNRYFAIDNPFSLLGSLSARIPSSFGSLMASIIASLASIPQSIANFASGQTTGPLAVRLLAGSRQQIAYAAQSADFQKQANFFGVQQWGWSQEEINRIETDPNFALDVNAAYVEAHPEFDKNFSKCYASNLLLKDLPPGCDAATLGSDEALHWRVYKAQSFVIDSMNQDVTKDAGF